MNSTPQPASEGLSEADRSGLPSHGQRVVLGLVEENRQLKLRIAKLEEQLRRNSPNSSQPPSQDRAEQKAVQEKAVGSSRQRGGQAGHVGHGRKLVPEELVDTVVVHRPTGCQRCGALLRGYDSK